MNKKLKTIVVTSAVALIVCLMICGVWLARSGSNSPSGDPIAKQPNTSLTPPDTSIPPEKLPSSDETLINKISAGDVVVVAISADDVRDMYGYQLCVNYNKALFEYSGGLKSDIAEISLIFKSQLEFDDYILVGALNIGDGFGFNGKDAQICHMTFTAVNDCEMADISISSVKVCDSSDGGLIDVRNWSCVVTFA